MKRLSPDWDNLKSESSVAKALQSIIRAEIRRAAKTGLDPAVVAAARDELEAVASSGNLMVVWSGMVIAEICRLDGVVVGPGRGSSVASSLLYVLGVNHINPQSYGLNWQAFVRSSGPMSDIDIDLDSNRRPEVLKRFASALPPSTLAQLSAQQTWTERRIKEASDAGEKPGELGSLLKWTEHPVGFAIVDWTRPGFFGATVADLGVPLDTSSSIPRLLIDGSTAEDRESGLVKLDLCSCPGFKSRLAPMVIGPRKSSTHLWRETVTKNLGDPRLWAMLNHPDLKTGGPSRGWFQVTEGGATAILAVQPRSLPELAYAIAANRKPHWGQGRLVEALMTEQRLHWSDDRIHEVLAGNAGFVVFQEDLDEVLTALGMPPNMVRQVRSDLKSQNKAAIDQALDRVAKLKTSDSDQLVTVAQWSGDLLLAKPHALAYALALAGQIMAEFDWIER